MQEYNPKHVVDMLYISLIFSVLFTTLFAFSSASPDALITNAYSNTDKYEEETYVNDYILCGEGVDSHAADELVKEMLCIPSEIYTHFLNSGWEIEIVENRIETEDWGKVLALYKPKDKTLELSSYYLNSVQHEMGHYFDKRMHPGVENSTLSSTDEWREAFQAEADSLKYIDNLTRYNAYNEQEAFAETFRLHITGKEEAKEKIPKMWALMEKYLQKSKEQFGSGQK